MHFVSVLIGQALHSNMEKGGACSWGGEDHWGLGWTLTSDKRRIQDGGMENPGCPYLHHKLKLVPKGLYIVKSVRTSLSRKNFNALKSSMRDRS